MDYVTDHTLDQAKRALAIARAALPTLDVHTVTIVVTDDKPLVSVVGTLEDMSDFTYQMWA